MEFGEKVRALRKQQNMSQSQLASICGVTERSILNYEHRNLVPKNKDVLLKLSETLHTTTDYLLSNESHYVEQARLVRSADGKEFAQQIINGTEALFAGGDISDEDKEEVFKAIQDIYFKSKFGK